MNVACIFEDGQYGGPQAYMIDLAVELRGKVNFVFIIPQDNSEIFIEKCKLKNINYSMLKLTHITKDFKLAIEYIFSFPFEVFKLVCLFNKKNFDLIYIAGGSWQYKGAIAAKLSKRILIWNLNDTYIPTFFKYIFGLLSGFASCYICVSGKTKTYYSNFLDKKKPTYIIPPPVNTKYFSPTTKPGCEVQLLDQWSKKIIIGSVCNINPNKGINTIIKAAHKLKDYSGHVEFIIVGAVFPTQTLYYEYLKNLLVQLNVTNVTFYGPSVNIKSLLSEFNIYLCASFSESGPISVWEAMSMEKIIVSTDVGDVSRYLGDNAGLISPVGDSEAIANNLRMIIKDIGFYQEMGKKARKMVIKSLDARICADSHLRIFNAIKK